MKLIIEIPEGLYYRAKWNQYAMKDNRVMREIIANGMPLDDIRNEITDKSFTANDGTEVIDCLVVMDIIDKHIGERKEDETDN